jgi:hypothetical protein
MIVTFVIAEWRKDQIVIMAMCLQVGGRIIDTFTLASIAATEHQQQTLTIQPSPSPGH